MYSQHDPADGTIVAATAPPDGAIGAPAVATATAATGVRPPPAAFALSDPIAELLAGDEAVRPQAAKRKALTKQTSEGMKVHSFQTLLGDLATIVKNRIQPKNKKITAFDILTHPTVIQQRALDLLRVTLKLT